MTEEKKRGFAALPPERLRELASQGGKAVHAAGTAHKFTAEEAREAGRKGGAVISANPGHMQEIGRLGGAAIAKNKKHMSDIGKKGGAKTSADREHMAEIGRKGGESRRAKREEEAT